MNVCDREGESKYEYIDENYNYAYELKDKLGRLVLSLRKVSSSQLADTYYRYDGKGNLTYVIPPVAANETDPLTFKYEYYDDDLLKKETDPDGNVHKYFYNSCNQLDAITDNVGLLPKDFIYSTATSGIEVGKLKTKSVKVIGLNNFLDTDYYYDTYGRVDWEESENYLGGKDRYDYTYDMQDKILTINRDHYDSSNFSTPDKEVNKRYEYDASGRLEEIYMRVDGDSMLYDQPLEYLDFEKGDVVSKDDFMKIWDQNK